MNIKITNLEDKKLIQKYAAMKKLPYTKAVAMAVRIAEEEPFLRGKIATLEFMYRLCRDGEIPSKKK
jgi:hypothetical protein